MHLYVIILNRILDIGNEQKQYQNIYNNFAVQKKKTILDSNLFGVCPLARNRLHVIPTRPCNNQDGFISSIKLLARRQYRTRTETNTVGSSAEVFAPVY